MIDPDTPKNATTILDSRTNTLNLIFSDEFNMPGRKFGPGTRADHMHLHVLRLF